MTHIQNTLIHTYKHTENIKTQLQSNVLYYTRHQFKQKNNKKQIIKLLLYINLLIYLAIYGKITKNQQQQPIFKKQTNLNKKKIAVSVF